MKRMNFPGRKDERQKEAKARQAESDNRTPEEQLKRLDEMGLSAEKERAKIAKRIEERELKNHKPKRRRRRKKGQSNEN